MRHAPIDSQLFITNRERLKGLLPKNSLAVVNANDIPPTNADGTLAMPSCFCLRKIAGDWRFKPDPAARRRLSAHQAARHCRFGPDRLGRGGEGSGGQCPQDAARDDSRGIPAWFDANGYPYYPVTVPPERQDRARQIFAQRGYRVVP